MPSQTRKTRTPNSQHDFPRYPNRVICRKLSRPEAIWAAESPACALPTILSIRRSSWMCSRARYVVGIKGCKYASADHTALIAEYEIPIIMAALGKPEDNGYAQRLMRPLQRERLLGAHKMISTTLTLPWGAFWKIFTRARALTGH